MNKFPKRVLFISMLLIVNILMLASCKSKDIYDDENLDYSIDINNENAKVLSIKDVENNSDDSDNELKLSKVIKNISDISIYNILITYEEINNKDNIVEKSQVFLDLTLNPNESSEISFFNDDEVKGINIVSYEYHTLDKEVMVNLKDDTVAINKSSVALKDSKEYEVLTTSEIYKVKNSNEIDTYALDIKNTSKKQLGNITVKIGQLDKDGTYIMVDSISLYNILKPSEDIKMEIKALDNTKSIELLGYSYDDIKEKANIVGGGFDSLSNYYTTYLKNEGVTFDSKLDPTSDKSEKAVDYYLDGVEDGYFRIAGTDKYLSAPFGNETIAMFVGSNASETFVKQGVNNKFEIGVAPYPAKEVMQQGTDLFVFNSATAEQKTAAYEFLKFLTTKDNQITWATQTGYIPVRESAINSDEYKNTGSLIAPIIADATKNLFTNPLVKGMDSAYRESNTVLESILAEKNPDVKSKLEAFKSTLMSIWE